MKKRVIFNIVLLFVFLFFVNFVFAASGFCGGTGTNEDPYLICDWSGLNAIRDKPNSNYRLNSNLNKSFSDYLKYNSQNGWVSIASFSGTFDGNGYTVSDLFINRPSENDVGLFGAFSTPKKIFNLNLFNANVTGGNDVGVLGGSLTSSILNVSVHGNVQGVDSVGCFFGKFSGSSSSITNSFSSCNVGGARYIGGFVGEMIGGKISNSTSLYSNISGIVSVGGFIGSFYGNPGNISDSISFYSNISGRSNVGGFVGDSFNVDILNARFIGNVSSTNYPVGGIAGKTTSGTISNSSSISDIFGAGYNLGGFIGDSFSTNISNSYSISTVYGLFIPTTSFRSVGGFIGKSFNTNISNSYSISNLSGISNVGGFIGDRSGGKISDSYSVSKIFGNEPIGGLFGNRPSGVNLNLYWDKEYSEINKACGSVTSCDNSFGKTTSEMKSLSTFSDWNISSGEEDLNFGYPYLASQVGRNDFVWLIPRAPACVSLGGYCSPTNIENSVSLEGSCGEGLSCYSCSEGYKFDSNFNCVEEGVSCVSGFGFSYWNKTLDEKEWTYNSNSDFSETIFSCNKYGGFCCPTSFVCEENGKCVYNDGSILEICSSLKFQDICNSNPEGYAKNEFDLFLTVSDVFGNDPCNSTWFFNSTSDKNQRSICFCSWNDEKNNCQANRSIEFSSSSNSGGSNTRSEPSSSPSQEDYWISTQAQSNCQNGVEEVTYHSSIGEPIQSQIPCIDELSLPFFGIFNIFFVFILLAIFYKLKFGY